MASTYEDIQCLVDQVSSFLRHRSHYSRAITKIEYPRLNLIINEMNKATQIHLITFVKYLK